MGHGIEESTATSGGGKAVGGGHEATSPGREGQGNFTTDEILAPRKGLGLRVESSATSQSVLTSSHPDADDEHYPPSPPRPGNLDLLQEGTYSGGSGLSKREQPSRPNLQSTATTALSRTDIHTQSYQDGSCETYAASVETTPRSKPAGVFGSIRRIQGLNGSEGGDSTSVKSYLPTSEAGGDVESLLGEVTGASQENSTWKLFSQQHEAPNPFDLIKFEDDEATVDFYREFDEIRCPESDEQNEGSGS